MKKQVPVGAAWEYTAPTGAGPSAGATGRVWLDRRHANGLEVWRWSFRFADEADGRGDWTPSYRLAVEECRVRFGGRKVRFKRVS